VGALKQRGGGFAQEQVTVAMIAEEGGGDIRGDRIVEDATDDFGFARAGIQEPDLVGSQQAFHADGQTLGGNAGVTEVG
jgi:hypothetical protein